MALLKDGIVIKGTVETRRALRQFDRDVLREMDREIRAETQPLIAYARNKVRGAQGGSEPPMSGWITWKATPYTKTDKTTGKSKVVSGKGWDKQVIDRGIKVKSGKRRKGSIFSALLQLRQESAAGSIFEMAGRTSSGKTASGRQFIYNLNNRNQHAGRSIYKAVDDLGVSGLADVVMRGYDRAAKVAQAALEKAGQ
jgi:hypothetical protein